MPLAGAVEFRFNKNALAMRMDEARHQNKFSIKEMILRSESDLTEKHMMGPIGNPAQAADTNMALRSRD